MYRSCSLHPEMDKSKIQVSKLQSHSLCYDHRFITFNCLSLISALHFNWSTLALIPRFQGSLEGGDISEKKKENGFTRPVPRWRGKRASFWEEFSLGSSKCSRISIAVSSEESGAREASHRSCPGRK